MEKVKPFSHLARRRLAIWLVQLIGFRIIERLHDHIFKL